MSLFITFEGTDATGKSTQVKLLAAALQVAGLNCVLTREPGGTPTAERIRELVLDPSLQVSERTELLLYLAARAEHVQNLIRPALADGKIVVCDRFMDSTLSYQGIARNLGLQEVLAVNSFATGGLLPDITFLLHAEPAVVEARRQARGQAADRLEAEGAVFKERVRQGFLNLQSLYPRRIKLINADQEIEQIHREIVGYLRSFLPLGGA